MKHKRFIIIGFLSTFATGLLLLNSSLLAKSPKKTDQSRHKALAKFVNVLDLVEKYNVDPITIDKIIDKALSGMLSNLDAHSSFLDSNHFKYLTSQTNGEFGGLGIVVGMKNTVLTVVSPIEGSPADKIGLKSGDIILKIEKESTLNMSMDHAINLMRGKPKTPINITVYRKNERKSLKFKIIRDIIKTESVYAKTIGNDILYVRIVSFDKKVVSSVKKHLKKYLPQKKGIILDLRSNPGGLLDQAIGLVDLFVAKGDIVSQKGRNKQETRVYSATSANTYANIPMVVLVNEGSASASEIVSGALQDLKRSIIVGTKTFGKGSVQIVMKIGESEAIKLTVARYYLPNGRTIQAIGVTPDITVVQGKVVTNGDNSFIIKETDLKNRLENELEKIDGKKPKKKKEIKDKKNVILKEQINNDLQLRSGIGILRALIITKK